VTVELKPRWLLVWEGVQCNWWLAVLYTDGWMDGWMCTEAGGLCCGVFLRVQGGFVNVGRRMDQQTAISASWVEGGWRAALRVATCPPGTG